MFTQRNFRTHPLLAGSEISGEVCSVPASVPSNRNPGAESVSRSSDGVLFTAQTSSEPSSARCSVRVSIGFVRVIARPKPF